LDKLLEYKRSWIQHVNRTPRNRLPRVMKHFSPTGRRNRGRTLNRLLDTWDRNGSTSGLTAWQIINDDDDDNDKLDLIYLTACQKLQLRKQIKLLINKNNEKEIKTKRKCQTITVLLFTAKMYHLRKQCQLLAELAFLVNYWHLNFCWHWKKEKNAK